MHWILFNVFSKFPLTSVGFFTPNRPQHFRNWIERTWPEAMLRRLNQRHHGGSSHPKLKPMEIEATKFLDPKLLHLRNPWLYSQKKNAKRLRIRLPKVILPQNLWLNTPKLLLLGRKCLRIDCHPKSSSPALNYIISGRMAGGLWGGIGKSPPFTKNGWNTMYVCIQYLIYIYIII